MRRNYRTDRRAEGPAEIGTPRSGEAIRNGLVSFDVGSLAAGQELLSWKRFAAHGRWAWWLEDAIDRRFVRKYR